MSKRQIWKCQRCGHETLGEPGEQIEGEFLCLENHGRCLGIVRLLLGIAVPSSVPKRAT